MIRQPPEGGKTSGILSAEVVEEELATLYAEILRASSSRRWPGPGPHD